jgi:hypothetical protein
MALQVEQRRRSLYKQNSSESVRSCSTTASSVSESQEANQARTRQSHSSFSELPEYDYPTPIFVRNTFLDTPIVRPLSLDEFIKDRRIKSCPLDTPDTEEAENPYVDRPATSNATLLTLAANDAAVAASRAVSTFCNWWSPAVSSAPRTNSSAALGADAVEQKPIICLANALAEPELGSPELPSVGSAGHRWGACKPCAFLHKRGCENGLQCDFCHLCDSGEKKRRQKDKITKLKEMRGVSSVFQL